MILIDLKLYPDKLHEASKNKFSNHVYTSVGGLAVNKSDRADYMDEESIFNAVLKEYEIDLIKDIFDQDKETTYRKLILNKDTRSGPIKELISILLNNDVDYIFRTINVDPNPMSKAGDILYGEE